VPTAEPARLVAGIQPVREAIRVHRDRLDQVLLDERKTPRLEAVARFASDQGVRRVLWVRRAELDRLSGGGEHQGAVAFAPALELLRLDVVLDDAQLAAVALDGVQDPQNFGAVLRSAVGIAGASVIWGEHASAPLTPATFRASAGAVEHARLCRVPSLGGALEAAASRGIAVVGLDAGADRLLSEVDLTGPSLLVIGSEATGMHRAVRRSCTALAKLLVTSRLDSLNASVAAGIALYELIRQRNSKLAS
jgi:23S rRNA (guanosine2251-2'-O)-methyltransferase